MKDIDNVAIYCENEEQFDEAIDEIQALLGRKVLNEVTWVSGNAIDDFSPYCLLYDYVPTCITLTGIKGNVYLSFQYTMLNYDSSKEFGEQIEEFVETLVQHIN